MYPILSKKELVKNTACQFVIHAPGIAVKAKPGQFVVLRATETGERIPLTIARAVPEEGTITIFVQIVGKTTSLLSTLNPGDSILDVMGPLGRPTEIEKFGTVVCVGGGIGVAEIYPITQACKDAGNRVIAVIGARSAGWIILEDEMRAASHEIAVCTDDGTAGRRGFVTDALKDFLGREGRVDHVFAVGPVPMMKAVSELTRPFGIPTTVSLNAVMVDGTGMCGGCRVSVGGKTKFCCVDGPDFNGHEVDFEELVKRQRAYLHHEKISRENHDCRIGLKPAKAAESGRSVR